MSVVFRHGNSPGAVARRNIHGYGLGGAVRRLQVQLGDGGRVLMKYLNACPIRLRARKAGVISIRVELEPMKPVSVREVLLLVCAACVAPCRADDVPVAPLESPEEMQYLFPDEQAATPLVGWRVRMGDSLQWASPAYVDSSWEMASGVGLWAREGAPKRGVRWYRKPVFFPGPPDSLGALAIYQQAVVAANEVYWDGVLIARNGTVAHSAEAEEPGVSALLFVIPRSLATPGRHLLALRVSNHTTFSGIIEAPLLVGSFDRIHRWVLRHGAVLLFLAGVFLFTGVFNIAVSYGYRDRWPYAIFSAFCFACAVHILIQALREYFQMDLGWYYIWAMLNDVPWFMMMTLLPVFFLYEFRFPRRASLSIAIAATAFVVVGALRMVTAGLLPVHWLDALIRANEIHSYLTIVLSAWVSIWAVMRREVGALASTAGLVVFLVGVLITYQLNLTYGWAIGFAMLIVFLTVSLSRQMARRNREYQEAQLRAARLEIDLLKKHIQPHFLLNSLNSIIAWLEEDPSTAATLVQALADELRMLLRFAREPSVSLAEEAKLCDAHLRVMGLRYGKEYELQTAGDLDSVRVPPLVVHTLVENGLTHGYDGKDTGLFRLECRRNGDSAHISLFNDSTVAEPAKPVEAGTGLRYVQTRLQELSPSGWHLESKPVENGWQVNIDLRTDT
ncbi:MAG: hypothetical protein GF331_12715 [Chitinivibrionales bacterium]|nr:hypothetical protein [Chitinivibrionales bacterium]